MNSDNSFFQWKFLAPVTNINDSLIEVHILIHFKITGVDKRKI